VPLRVHIRKNTFKKAPAHQEAYCLIDR